MKVPVGLVHEYEVLARRLERSKVHLISLALSRWLEKPKAGSPVDERVLKALAKERIKVPLRLHETVVHRLQKLARERQLSIHWLVEDLLIQALPSLHERSRPEQRLDIVPRAIRHLRRSYFVVIQWSLVELYDEQALRLRYRTRADLIEEVLSAAVEREEQGSYLSRMLTPAADEPAPGARVQLAKGQEDLTHS